MTEKKKEYTLVNFTIRDLKKAEGISEKNSKPWIRFKFKTTDSRAGDREFTYFPYGLTHPETWPYDGAKVSSMIFTITEDGQYAGDCNVKKILYDPGSVKSSEENPFGKHPSGADPTPPQKALPIISSETITKEQGVCLSYIKDLMVARLAWIDHKNLPTLPELADELATVGAQFYRDVINNLKRME